MEVITMYTWGYIKNSALAKIDIDAEDAVDLKLQNKFPYYANEAITQISSAVKPKRTHAVFKIYADAVGVPKKMPTDFISFGCDKNTVIRTPQLGMEDAYDDSFSYYGNDEIVFWEPGEYQISYNARWEMIYPNTPDDTVLNMPVDVAECLPSYIAHQCLKTIDEYKAAVFRNEYEMFLARINDSYYQNELTFTIQGDW